ncbi:MFS general substrate transporter [Amniculicola lignicola CBS 123094]|uniref:MFS general substrate transporter n=1 Tax=Amniculicola lignicola CBS 123094 TaxID=1392246 RepID=A0A6A5WJC8_9PLEO|nr:MFS general substrate transporter [Amniculicola lignicola CBS 123094]
MENKMRDERTKSPTSKELVVKEKCFNTSSSASSTNIPVSHPSTPPATTRQEENNNLFPREAIDADLHAYPQIIDEIPFAAWAAILAGGFERFTYFGLIAPWQNYMQNARHSALPGALGLGQASATNISNAFFLSSFLTPMLFAVVSDTKLGRYKTLLIGLACYLAGCVVLVGTSVGRALDRGAGVPGMVVTIFLVALGSGCVKACFVPFLGDQLGKGGDRVEMRGGRVVVVSRGRTLQAVMNAYYWFTNVASLSSIPITYLEHHYGFWQSYLLPTLSIFVSIVLFVLFGPKYVKLEPGGNVLPKAARTLICAAKNRLKLDHAKPEYQQAHHGKTVAWSDSFVEEIRKGLVACKVIFSLLIFYLIISQMYNNLVSQAGTMTLGSLPNDLPQAFSGVACIIFGPLIQGMYSVLARYKIRFGPIARLTFAFIFCGLSMAYAAGIQKLIYSSGPCYSHPFKCAASSTGGKQPNMVSVWLQIPVYFLLAIGEIFGFVTAFEYAYAKAPQEMKSVVMAFSQLTAGFASGVGMAISPAAKDPNMVIMYACLAGAMGITAVAFWWFFRDLDGIDRQLDQELGGNEDGGGGMEFGGDGGSHSEKKAEEA